MNTHDIELPPLPEPFTYTRPGKSEGALFHAGHMQDYAREAIEADRQRRGEPVAWLYEVDGGSGEWEQYLHLFEPLQCSNVRNVQPLYAAPQPADPVVKNSLTTEKHKCDGNHGGPRCADP